jgi:hypothetical protein
MFVAIPLPETVKQQLEQAWQKYARDLQLERIDNWLVLLWPIDAKSEEQKQVLEKKISDSAFVLTITLTHLGQNPLKSQVWAYVHQNKLLDELSPPSREDRFIAHIPLANLKTSGYRTFGLPDQPLEIAFIAPKIIIYTDDAYETTLAPTSQKSAL